MAPTHEISLPTGLRAVLRDEFETGFAGQYTVLKVLEDCFQGSVDCSQESVDCSDGSADCTQVSVDC